MSDDRRAMFVLEEVQLAWNILHAAQQRARMRMAERGDEIPDEQVFSAAMRLAPELVNEAAAIDSMTATCSYQQCADVERMLHAWGAALRATAAALVAAGRGDELVALLERIAIEGPMVTMRKGGN